MKMEQKMARKGFFFVVVLILIMNFRFCFWRLPIYFL